MNSHLSVYWNIHFNNIHTIMYLPTFILTCENRTFTFIISHFIYKLKSSRLAWSYHSFHAQNDHFIISSTEITICHIFRSLISSKIPITTSHTQANVMNCSKTYKHSNHVPSKTKEVTRLNSKLWEEMNWVIHSPRDH